MALAKTTRDHNHTHLVYVSEQTGEGITSAKKGHQHIVTLTEDGIFFAPAEDGHTHELAPYEPKRRKRDKETDSDKVAKVHALFKAAENVERKSRKDAAESEKFYMGDQWDKATKSELANAKRAAITINEIEAKVDILTGFQQQNRTDLQFAPVEEGDGGAAQVLDAFYRNVEDQNCFPSEEAKVFKDVVVAGRGNFHVYMDFDEDIQGKITIEQLPWRDVYYGPHNRLDLGDCEHITKSKMFSRAKVKQMWPEKSKETDLMFHSSEIIFDEDNVIYDNPGDQYATGDKVEAAFDGKPLIDIERREVRVFETYFKEYYTLYSLVIEIDGEVVDLPDLSKSEADEWDTVDVVRVVRRNRYRIRRFTVAGNVFLEEDELEEFPIVPVYAKKVGDYWYGKVQSVKDAQREINKRHSQSIDILNKAASYGWIIDDNTFDDAKSENDFRQNSSTPGYVTKVADMRNKPELVAGTKVPGEVLGMMELASGKIQTLMNIPFNIADEANIRDVSGVAIREKRRSIQMANEYLFSNLDAAKRRLAKVVLKFAQDFYPPERIARVVINSKPRSDQDMQANQLAEQEILAVLQNSDLLKYDVTPIPSASSPTARSANFQIALELAKQGFPIPPEVIIKMSDFSFKEQILGQMEQQAQASAAAQSEAAEAEKFKSLPDEIKAQLMSSGQVQVGTPPQQEVPQ